MMIIGCNNSAAETLVTNSSGIIVRNSHSLPSFNFCLCLQGLAIAVRDGVYYALLK